MPEQQKNIHPPVEALVAGRVKDRAKEIAGETDLVRSAWRELQVDIRDDSSVMEGLERWRRDQKKLKKLIAFSEQWKVISEYVKKELESTVLPLTPDDEQKQPPSRLSGWA